MPAPKTMAGRLMANALRLHPKVRFCGNPPDAILDVPEDLLGYILSVLRGTPIARPVVSLGQWSQLLPVLAPHGIIPLLYQCLKELPKPSRPPHEIMDKMRYAYLMHTGQALRDEKQMQKITEAFAKVNVRVIALKGFALARMVYPGPGTRPGSDLDLLVVPHQMPEARAILKNIGYDGGAALFNAGSGLYKDEYFVHKQKQRYHRTIELHWRLHSFLGISQDAEISELFDRAVTVKSENVTFEALDIVDAIIHRAINNAYGHDEHMRLIWLYDMVLLTKKLVGPDDWQRLQQRCVVWRARLAVELSFEMAGSWLGLELPPGFDDFATWPRPSKIETIGWARLISRHHSLLTTLQLRMPPAAGFLERTRFFIRLVFPLRDKVCRDFPVPDDRLFFLSYVKRWLYWVKKLQVKTMPRAKTQRR